MSGWRFVLRSLDSPLWAGIIVCATIAALAACAILFRYERRLVPRRVGRRLLLLRLGTLLLVALALLEPVMAWRTDRTRTGRVVVVLDLSQSMNTTDAHAGKAEKLRWARSLGLIGNPQIDERLDGWIKAFETGDEPEWVSPEETANPARREELSGIRREHIEHVIKQIDGLSRKELARRLLIACKQPLVAQLREEADVQLAVFSSRVELADEGSLSAFVAEPPKSLQTDVSDIGVALGAAGSDAKDVEAVILLSDGRDNAGRNPIQTASQLGARSVPVFAVLAGSESRPRDVAIVSLDYPHTAFLDDHPLLEVSLSTAGFEGDELEVSLEREGAEAVKKTVRPQRATASMEFPLSADELGRYEYTVRVVPQKAETRTDNNLKTFAMSVVDDKVGVLLLDEEARWEFRYLDNALGRDERVRLDHVLFRQPFIGILESPFFPQRLDSDENVSVENAGKPSTPFADTDLVIMGDVSPEHLPPSVWDNLERFVGEQGGTLVLTAGRRSVPFAHQSAVMSNLLPVQNLRTINLKGTSEAGSPTERGFHLRLTPAGEDDPMLQFNADPAENQRIWSGLPGHFWGIVGEAKPGATVLARAMLPDGNVNANKGAAGDAIIASHRYGFGHVVWVGVDSTWRWRHRVGDAYHHRFWGQLARFAAKNKAIGGNQFVRFGPERSDIDEWDDLVIRAQWSNEFLARFPKVTSKAEIYAITDGSPRLVSILDLKPAESKAASHEGNPGYLPPGIYRIKLAADNADLGTEEIATTLHVHQRQSNEMSNVTANRELLVKLAEASGGGFFTPDEAHKIPSLLRQSTNVESKVADIELWDHWLMLLGFLALTTIEWTVRKRNGLP